MWRFFGSGETKRNTCLAWMALLTGCRGFFALPPAHRLVVKRYQRPRGRWGDLFPDGPGSTPDLHSVTGNPAAPAAPGTGSSRGSRGDSFEPANRIPPWGHRRESRAPASELSQRWPDAIALVQSPIGHNLIRRGIVWAVRLVHLGGTAMAHRPAEMFGLPWTLLILQRPNVPPRPSVGNALTVDCKDVWPPEEMMQPQHGRPCTPFRA